MATVEILLKLNGYKKEEILGINSPTALALISIPSFINGERIDNNV